MTNGFLINKKNKKTEEKNKENRIVSGSELK